MTLEPLKGLTCEALEKLGDTAGDAALLRRYVASGIARVWRINGGDSYAVTALDAITESVWVICYAGSDVIEFLTGLKKAYTGRYRRIVFHTRSEAVARLARRAGAEKIGIVCEVDL